MTPSTLYELAGLPASVPAEQVRSAALVEGANHGREASAALAILADPAARADYDARSSQGLAFELALAWGVAAFAVADAASARTHFERALRISPDDRAVPLLLETLPSEAEPLPGPADAARAAARREVARLRNNSAFPHRLIRYAASLAGEDNDSGIERSDVMANAARELLQYDVVEAPRSYAMILPVLREHYPAAYALDVSFFDATSAVLADHTPAAEYERGKRRYRETGGLPPPRQDAPPPLDLSNLKLPPLRIPERRLDLSSLPRPGYSWVGAVIGAVLLVEDGLYAMVGGAVIGFALLYGVMLLFRRR